jgi:ribonuclease BN (tRNA processing enzyme)
MSWLPDARVSYDELSSERKVPPRCGTVASVLSIEEQKALEWALITHAHLDHVKDILFLADNLCTGERDPFIVMAPQGIIDLLHANLFNNVIWPDFRLFQPWKIL